MRAKLMLTLAATAAAMVFPPVIDAVRAEGQAALTGIVSSEAEGTMEGVVVTARRAKSIVQVSVTTNAEWMMSIPGTEEQKAGLLNCVGCHTLERVMRSTHDSDEWTQVISRMLGYGAVR